MDIKELFKEKVMYLELDEAEKTMKDDELRKFKNDIRMYIVPLIKRVKNKDDGAFEELLETKDMRNFIHHHAYHTGKYFRFKYKQDDIFHEMKVQIFYHIVKNYRIYNEPHEMGLLIMSMRSWIRLKVSEALRSTYKPKDDEYIDSEVMDLAEIQDTSEKSIERIADEYLDDEEREVFEKRFFEDKLLVEIGNEMGFSKDTASRRYKNSLEKLKRALELNK